MLKAILNRQINNKSTLIRFKVILRFNWKGKSPYWIKHQNSWILQWKSTLHFYIKISSKMTNNQLVLRQMVQLDQPHFRKCKRLMTTYNYYPNRLFKVMGMYSSNSKRTICFLCFTIWYSLGTIRHQTLILFSCCSLAILFKSI